MADKYLSESDWQKFAKGRGLKDAPLLKAMAAFEKAKDPAARLDALDEVEKQSDLLRKAGKGDKEMTAYFDGVDKALDKERKLARTAAREAEAAESEGEEEESPLLITTKMIPLLRQVKKGDEMQVMIASTGKDVAVLMSRRTISPTRRKLLADYLQASSVKVILGHCIFEDNAHTFVLKTQAAGLAKKVRAALLKQAEMRVKVRVRGEDPDDIDDDGEPPEAEQDEGESTQGLKAGTIPEAPPLKPAQAPAQGSAPGAPDADAAAFNARLAALMPSVKEFIVAAGPKATDLKLKVSEAGVFARKKEYVQANALLDDADALMKPASNIPEAPPMPGPREASAAAPTALDANATTFNARLAALMPRVKETIVAAGPDANDVKLKVSEAGVSARKKEFAQANALLDEVDKMLEAGGAAAGGTGSQEEEEEEAEQIDPKERESAELHARLQPDFEAIERGPLSPALAEQFQPIRTAWMMAVDAIENAQFDRSSLILKRIDGAGGLARLLQAMTDEARQPRARGAASGGAVAMAKMRLKWNAARAARLTAIDSMMSVASELLETEEYEDDPRTEAAAAKIRDLSAQVPVLDEKLSGLLDDFAQATDQGARDQLRTRIRASIQAYRGQLDDQPLLMALQNTPLGFTPIGETIYNALTALDAALA
jgi:hypothetical protein